MLSTVFGSGDTTAKYKWIDPAATIMELRIQQPNEKGT
jgi:hypothetical protein